MENSDDTDQKTGQNNDNMLGIPKTKFRAETYLRIMLKNFHSMVICS